MPINSDDFKRRLKSSDDAKLAFDKLVKAGFPEDKLVKLVLAAVLVVRRRGDLPEIPQSEELFVPTKKKDVQQAEAVAQKAEAFAEKLCGTSYYQEARQAAKVLRDIAQQIGQWYDDITWPQKGLGRRRSVGPRYRPYRRRLIEESKRLTKQYRFNELAAILVAAHEVLGHKDSAPSTESLKMEFYRKD